MNFIKTNIWFIVALALGVILLVSKLTQKEPEEKLVPGKTKVVYLNDSTKYYQQQAAISNYKDHVAALQDSLEKAVSKNAHTNPTTIVRVTEQINYDSLKVAYTGSLRDSLEKYKNLSDSAFKKQELTSYAYSDNWLTQKGRILGGGITIDSLRIRSKEHILVSEHKKFLGKTTLNLQIVNENPHVDYSGIESYIYQPKRKAFGLTIGPSTIFDGKQVRFGVGATIGFKIF